MKKIFLMAAMLLTSLAASAQFEAGTRYVGLNTAGFGLSYSKATKFQLGLGAEAGYFFKDNWMVRGGLNFEHQKHRDDVGLSAGVRYYWQSNGVFVGGGLAYDHFSPNIDSIGLPIEVGYCFYLNHNLSIEPAAYYKMSLNEFGDCSSVGLRIGVGYYF